MDIDGFCKYLTERSVKNLGVETNKLYSAQFDYADMVNRLKKLKREKEKKEKISSYSNNFSKPRRKKTLSIDAKKGKSEKRLGLNTERHGNNPISTLPKIASSRIIIKDSGNLSRIKSKLAKSKLVSVYSKIKSERKAF